MKILRYIIILTFFIGCNVSDKTDIKLLKGKAVVEGQVKKFTDSSRVLRFYNFSVVRNIEQIAMLDSYGNFKTELELFYPQEVGLSYENADITLYLHPGDTLYLNLDADKFKKDSYPYYAISGKNLTTSQNIRDYLKSHTSFTNDPRYKPNYNEPFKKFLSDIKKHLAVEDSDLQEFYKRNNPTNEFMNWAKNDILYYSFGLFMNYYWVNVKRHKEYETEIFNTGLFPRNDSVIGNSSYIWFLSQYPIMKYSAIDSIAMQLLRKKNIRNSFSRTFDNLIKNEKPGLSRNIMIYEIFDMFFEGRVSKSSVEDVTTLFEKYKPYISNKVLNSNLEEKVSNFIHPGNEIETISNLKSGAKSETIAKFWEMVETKHKDKIIYIDIWTTWCAPCRHEISHALDSYNYFKDKPVAFVNLCLGSNRDEWKKLVGNIRQMSDNYFFSKDESDLLGNELKVYSFPTHMIINKKGELITKNIPGISSSKEIKNLLTKLIGE